MPAQQPLSHDRLRIRMIGEGEHRLRLLAEEFAGSGHEVLDPASAAPADVVHVFGWAAVAAAGPPGEPAAVASLDPPDRGLDPGIVALGQFYDRVIAPSTDAARSLLAVGVRRDRLAVVPDGVDADFFHIGSDGPGLRPSRRTPCIVGVRPALDPPHVIDLLAAVRRVPEARLYIAGGPPSSRVRQDERARKAALAARKLGVASRVFLLGDVPPERMPDLYRTADVVVCTGEPDAPRIALEAMACAVPVVAYAEGAVADILIHAVSGVLVEAGNPKALADAVRDLLASEPRRYAYAVGGLSRVQERFTWPRVAEQIDGVYRAALADRQGRPAAVDF